MKLKGNGYKYLGHFNSDKILKEGHNTSVVDWFKKTFGIGKAKIVATDVKISRQQEGKLKLSDILGEGFTDNQSGKKDKK